MLLKLLTLTVFFLAVALADQVTPVVPTQSGPVFGFVDTRFGSYSFRGIPFAAPPVGNLRFAPPQDPRPWENPRNATTFGPGCYSRCNGKFASLMCAKTVSEDCLYLNVYTPSLSTTANLPVIVFIHGGFFTWGSGGIPLYDGARWAMNQSVVIVTINYRLNIFGGLYTPTIGGNFHIQDQRKALQWVRRNINWFGGDRNRVTVSGQSAGATSVQTHLVSPLSYPYFQRVAIISNPVGLPPLNLKLATEFGTAVLLKLKCPIGGSVELECLRNLTAEELFKAEKTEFLPTPNEVLAMFMPWGPTIDGVQVPEAPVVAMQKGNMAKVPVYIGTVANETAVMTFGIKKFSTWFMDIAVDYVFGIETGTKALQLYNIPMVNDSRPDVTRIMTDYIFYCPTRYTAGLASKYNGARTYNYMFDYHPSWAAWYLGGPTAPCAEYICHAFDLPYIFDTTYQLPSGFPGFNQQEKDLAYFIQKAWAQFASNGKIDNWPVYTAASHTAYNLSAPLPTAPLVGYRQKYCDFWDSVGYNRY